MINKKQYQKEYREKNKDKIKEVGKEYREKNKDKIKEVKKEYYEKNKDKIKEYREKNKDKIKEVKKEYREKNKDKIKEVGKEYYEKNKDKIKESRLMRKYGLSLEDYEKMLVSQKYICPICKEKLDINENNGKRIVVDHDHNTEAVRGLIHANCNSLLGFAGDNNKILLNAKEYLEQI